MPDESFYVAISFAVVVGIFLYLRLPQRLMKALDDKSAAIADELAQARQLREEAQALLARYQEQGKQAEKQADEILAQARAMAQRQAGEARHAMEQQIERRTKQAEERIARAEHELAKEVRAAIATLAAEAGRQLIATGLDSKTAKSLIENNISDLPDRLQ